MRFVLTLAQAWQSFASLRRRPLPERGRYPTPRKDHPASTLQGSPNAPPAAASAASQDANRHKLQSPMVSPPSPKVKTIFGPNGEDGYKSRLHIEELFLVC